LVAWSSLTSLYHHSFADFGREVIAVAFYTEFQTGIWIIDYSVAN
ncbi:2-oxo-3-deoxygalactonate kinase, partial [Klebsiella pneumoniae]|nr:2-oxo-3-deoxygalactonate kinase [Klebsiella pneumoniae]